MTMGIWWAEVKLPLARKLWLLDLFKSIKAIYEGTTKDYKSIGLDEESINVIQTSKEAYKCIQKKVACYQDLGIQIVSIEDKDYPTLLKKIYNPPIVLYVKGDKKHLNTPAIAIVGSRKCSEYGFEVASYLGKSLAQKGLTVVSGMASGIDEAAHKGALQIGNTIAVLGTGVDVCYPSKNKIIYQDTQTKGCIVSEFPPKTQGLPHHFPMRNRIISGMCLGVVVVEAQARSGSLITAELALEQNRDVFAVPGNIQSALSCGTNQLIQEGAKLVLKAEDILEEYVCLDQEKQGKISSINQNNPPIALDKLQNLVYDCLSWQPIEIGMIQKDISISAQELEMVLLQLELKGLAKRLPAKRYSRVK